MKGLQKYILAGLLAVIPLLVTWVVFDFVLGLLAGIGAPAVRLLSRLFETQENFFARWLLEPWTQWILAILLTVLALYLLGLLATRMVGKRLIGLIERGVARVPLVQKVYGGARHFINVMQPKADDARLAVLIEFPQKGMKSLGFVTRVISDRDTGEQLAVVYVPASPIPTSGNLVFVPMDKVVRTGLSFDEAMAFILTGGSQGLDAIRFSATAVDAVAIPDAPSAPLADELAAPRARKASR